MRVALVVGHPDWYRGVLESLRPWVEVEQVVLPDRGNSAGKLATMARRFWRELRGTPTILRLLVSRDEPPLLLCSTHQLSALLAGRLAGYLGERTKVYLFHLYLFGQAYDFHGVSQNRFARMVLRYLLAQEVGIFLTSPNEAKYYRQLAPEARIEYYPYAADDVPQVPEDSVELGDYVFAGGHSNRDYGLLLAAARRLPASRFILVCSSSNRLPTAVPPNVQVHRDLDPATFHTLMAGSRCVVVPLKEDVGSSGQMVAIAAMQLGKLTIYADFPSVAQYFTAGLDGLTYRPGDLEDLCARLEYCLTNRDAALSMGARSRERYLRDFTAASFYERIVDHFLTFAEIEH